MRIHHSLNISIVNANEDWRAKNVMYVGGIARRINSISPRSDERSTVITGKTLRELSPRSPMARDDYNSSINVDGSTDEISGLVFK